MANDKMTKTEVATMLKEALLPWRTRSGRRTA